MNPVHERSLLNETYRFDDIIGNHPLLIDTLWTVSKIADTDATVLILGESGTGKELIAKAIHANSKRHNQPMIALNCGALPDTLLESELFGHAKGAFTGATSEKAGWFCAADGGTLFFDEVHAMSAAMQMKLLRVLQTGEYHVVGRAEILYCDVRVVAATSQDIEGLVRKGDFREELFYRLNVIDLVMPPLRERRSDILPLIQHYLKIYCERYNKPLLELNDAVFEALVSYDYPGNIRELKNLVERLVVLSRTTAVEPAQLPPRFLCGRSTADTPTLSTFQRARQCAIEKFEKRFVIDCLRASNGNISRAARFGGIHATNLHSKIRKYDIDPTQFKSR